MSNQRFIVGFAGKAGCGKDTAAAVFESFGFARIGFADHLKKVAAVLFSNPIQCYTLTKHERDPFWGDTYRSQLQRLGTDAIRTTFGDEFWVRHMEKTIQGMEKRLVGTARVVIPDVRFEIEAEWLRAQGGLLIHMEGRQDELMSTEDQGHVSEDGVKFQAGRDRLMYNKGSLEAFQHNVRQLAQGLVY